MLILNIRVWSFRSYNPRFMYTFHHDKHISYFPRPDESHLIWTGLRDASKSRRIYQKPLHQKLRNQSAETTTFLPLLFPIRFCLNLERRTKEKRFWWGREIRISFHNQSQRLCFVFFLLLALKLCQKLKLRIYGTFRFISQPTRIVLFSSSLSDCFTHTKQLLINHLFKLVFCTTSINYLRSASICYLAFDLTKRNFIQAFVCKLFLFAIFGGNYSPRTLRKKPFTFNR